MRRREFLRDSLLAIVGGKLVYDLHSDFQQSRILHKIYHELPKHIYLADTRFETAESASPVIQSGSGIIYGGKYITMSHIVTIFPRTVRIGPMFMQTIPEVLSQETWLHGRKLELLFKDEATDAAIFRLPKGFELPEFPTGPQYERELGEEIYIIGNPATTGVNIRRTTISRNKPPLERIGLEPLKNRPGSFGIGANLIPGDSGTPVINSKGELIGLSSYLLAGMGYAKEIKLYELAKFT